MQLNKNELRAAMKLRKAAMVPQEIAEKSSLLCSLVVQSEAYKCCRSLYGYYPFNQEVDILPLLHRALQDGKQVALPKCYGKEMQFILISDLSRIACSRFGAPEPMEDGPAAHDLDALVIVPGLAFDQTGYRIGYGGGYYDRFLAAEPGHPTIALCFDFQLTQLPPPDPHDIPVHTVFAR